MDSSFGSKGFIFDLDGVVVDTSAYHYQAWSRMAQQLGFDFGQEQFRDLLGCDRITCLEQILQWGQVYISDAEKLYWSDMKNKWYIDLIATMGPDEVLPGVGAFLADARRMGIKTALVSSSSNAGKVLESTRLSGWFDIVIDGTMTRKSKPHPERYLLAAAGLQVDASACIVFEDSASGIKACKIGGFRVVGVGFGQHLEEADLQVPDFSSVGVQDILQHFELPVFRASVS